MQAVKQHPFELIQVGQPSIQCVVYFDEKTFWPFAVTTVENGQQHIFTNTVRKEKCFQFFEQTNVPGMQRRLDVFNSLNLPVHIRENELAFWFDTWELKLMVTSTFPSEFFLANKSPRE